MFALVDDEDEWLVTPGNVAGKWSLCGGSSKHGKYAQAGVHGENRSVFMHRLIMGEPKCFVDHVNGNRLDNRKSNLRLSSHSSNQGNRGRAPRNSSSGILGVRRYKGSWRATITIGGKQIHLGTFATKEAARVARRAKEVEFFGEFASRANAQGGE